MPQGWGRYTGPNEINGTCAYCNKSGDALRRLGFDDNGRPKFYHYAETSGPMGPLTDWDSCWGLASQELELNQSGEFSERQLVKKAQDLEELQAKERQRVIDADEALRQRDAREAERAKYEQDNCSCVHRCKVHDLDHQRRIIRAGSR